MDNLAALAAHRLAIQRLVPVLDAVRAVAEIAWRRAERGFRPLARYGERLEAAFDFALSALEPAERLAFLAAGAHTPVALLVVSAERGLCGAFNERLVAHALRHAATLSARGRAVHFLSLGSRGRRLLEAAGRPPLYAHPLASLATPTYVDVEGVALDLIDQFERRVFGQLIVVHNAPLRRFQYGVEVRELLPPKPRTGDRRAAARLAVKPADDLPGLLTHLLTEHLLIGLYEAVIRSAMSEQLARVEAMRLATDNAGRLVDRLSLEYTRARNAAATQALLEIVAGYQATTRAEPERR